MPSNDLKCDEYVDLVFMRPPRSAGTTPGQDDDINRSMSSFGEGQLPKMVGNIKHLDLKVVLHSPAKRAQETAKALGLPMIEVDALYPVTAEVKKIVSLAPAEEEWPLQKYFQRGFLKEFEEVNRNIAEAIGNSLHAANLISIKEWKMGRRISMCYISHNPFLMAALHFSIYNIGFKGEELRNFALGYILLPGEAIYVKRMANGEIEWKILEAT